MPLTACSGTFRSFPRSCTMVTTSTVFDRRNTCAMDGPPTLGKAAGMVDIESVYPLATRARATIGLASMANRKLSALSRWAESPPVAIPVVGSHDDPRGLLSLVWGLPTITFCAGLDAML